MVNKLFFLSFRVCVVLVLLASISACSRSDLADLFAKTGELPEDSGSPAGPQNPQTPPPPEESYTPPLTSPTYTWYVSSIGKDADSGTDRSSPLATVSAALARIKAVYRSGTWPSGIGATIEVSGRIVGPAAFGPYSSMVEIYGTGNYPHIILKGDSVSGGILDANRTATNGRVLYIAQNKVTLGPGLVLTGGRMLWGGAVCVGINGEPSSAGEFIVDGGEMRGNNAGSGGAVMVYRGVMRMISGVIKNNYNNFNNNQADGGGVYMNEYTTLFMSGGTISDNGSTPKTNKGGGIFIEGMAVLNMTGGEILRNTSVETGGGVYVTGYGTFNMSDGTISGNTSAEGGGVGVSQYSAVFNKTGGTISGNTPN